MIFLRVLGAALLAAVWCPAEDVQIAFRYDENHVLFYAAKRRDPATFSMADVEKINEKGPVADYGAGGYFLPLTEDRLRIFEAGPANDEESAGDIPRLRSTFTVFLGGADKVRVTAERYVEQWGIENPVVRVDVIARTVADGNELFHKAQASAFLLSKKDRLSLPTATAQSVCANCQHAVLNRFPLEGELILEQWEAGWAVTLYRRTATGLRGTKVSYLYAD